MPSRPSLLRSFLLFPAVLAVAGAPRAGTAVRMTIADLLGGSEICVEGRVLSAAPRLGSSGRIDTEYTLQVASTFWGDLQAVRTVRLPGGVLPDGRGMVLPGLPALAVGEEVILFLSVADPTGMRVPVGLAQGKLEVVLDREGRRRLVRDLRGLSFAEGRGAEEAVLGYEATVAEIEAAAAERRSREATGRRDGKAGR